MTAKQPHRCSHNGGNSLAWKQFLLGFWQGLFSNTQLTPLSVVTVVPWVRTLHCLTLERTLLNLGTRVSDIKTSTYTCLDQNNDQRTCPTLTCLVRITGCWLSIAMSVISCRISSRSCCRRQHSDSVTHGIREGFVHAHNIKPKRMPMANPSTA